MNKTDVGGLRTAYRSGKDPRVRARILAVHMVRVRKKGAGGTAAGLPQSEKWVRNWLGRHDRGGGGLDGLWDLPRTGSPGRFHRRRWTA